uniref:Fizzy-related protein homolog n=1 Tax=Bos indicus x Bos taurus TaxID=30522 RepID=A0A4W2G148_BOBOX
PRGHGQGDIAGGALVREETLALGALRHPAHPAVLPGGGDAANPDPCQLPRVLPQQAWRPLHPLTSWCQLEREFPQDQREGLSRVEGETLTVQPGGRGPSFPLTLPSPLHLQENEKSPSQNRKAKDATSDNGKDGLAYSALLKNELLGAGIEKVQDPQTEDRRLQPSTPERKGLFTYSLSTKRSSPDDGNDVSPYSLSPVSNKSQKLLRSPRKPTRKISKIPFKVLDAPELQDDFYLNLVDWSSLNVLSVGLGTCVYLWSACTSQVTRLCDLSVEGDSVTSVGWSERGNLVAVGTHKGFVQIWDAAAGKKLSMLEGHTARVGALAWNADQLSSGSRDRMILQRDIRTPPLQSERRLQGHRQEVCGLKWSTDHQLLASGGNDNKLLVWNHSSLSPVQQYTEHLAAVKAIAWSPHQHGLLASGGGTADRCIRFWNTLTGQPLQCIDTGSQVCNLAWSKHANELVSTHGYSQNQILVWKYPSLTQVAKLTGHSYRVLYLAMSPDGEAIVTGAGDETLRFWNVFSKTRSTKESVSVLNLFTRIR